MLVVVFSLHAGLMSYFPRYFAEQNIITRLQHDAGALIKRLVIQPDTLPRLRGRHVPPIYSSPLSGHYFQIETSNGLIQSPSLSEERLSLPPMQPSNSERLYLNGPEGQPLLVWRYKVQVNGQAVEVSFAEEIGDLKQEIAQLQQVYLVGITTTVILLILLQRSLIRRSLKPVDSARQELKLVEQGKVERIAQAVPSEIQPLVDEINHLLAVMRKRIEQSRNATGNLAHALKTPLSVLNQLTDTEEIQAHPQLVEEISQLMVSMQTAINRELKRARLAGKIIPGQHFNATAEIPDLISMMRKVNAEKQLEFEIMLPAEAGVQADREDMLELLGNLIDNACKWASQHVRLSVELTPDWQLTIEDDGPGVDVDALVSLSQRGTRLDEKTPGHGLGLSIVEEIVDQYDGKLTFTHSARLGGLKVEVTIPHR